LEPGPYVCLSVTDFGEGMDEDTLKRATEPFFTTKGLGKGTGLGLPMVHGVVEQSGGRFVLKSRVGEGTTAELWLPVATDAAPAAALTQPASAAKNQGSLVVLAVDDDELVLTNTVAMLEDLGHTAFAAASGAQALELLAKHTIDVVVTDQAMPLMTGLQLADTIARTWPTLDIIIATGYAEMGPNTRTDLPILAKPFTQAELASELDRSAARVAGTARIIRFPVSHKAAD
jgi:CheY-like chemotaxis protein